MVEFMNLGLEVRHQLELSGATLIKVCPNDCLYEPENELTKKHNSKK